MKLTLAAAVLMVATAAFAHDEGHGPKLTDTPRQGGIVSPVVNAADAKLGPKAALVYKAELVRLDDGTVRVHYYDSSMQPLALETFAKTAKALLLVERRGKTTRTPFDLTLQDGVYTGKAPTPSAKPFNIDVTVQEGHRKLLAAFDNLD